MSKQGLLVWLLAASATSVFSSEEVSIGNSVYNMERITEMDEESRNYQILRMGVNSAGDLYSWGGFMPMVLKVGATAPENVSGMRPLNALKSIVIDSKDNIYFSRTFDGISAIWQGTEVENTILGVYSVDYMEIDIHDNLYIFSYIHEMVSQVKIAPNLTTGWDIPISTFKYGLYNPAALDSLGNIYFKESFGALFYQNLTAGISSKKKIGEFGNEEVMGAMADSKDNVLVASRSGLYYIPAGTKGDLVQQLALFKDQKINCVYVDWRHNDTIYLAVDKQGIFRLTRDRTLSTESTIDNLLPIESTSPLTQSTKDPNSAVRWNGLQWTVVAMMCAALAIADCPYTLYCYEL